jgi:hypothetical protein
MMFGFERVRIARGAAPAGARLKANVRKHEDTSWHLPGLLPFGGERRPEELPRFAPGRDAAECCADAAGDLSRECGWCGQFAATEGLDRQVRDLDPQRLTGDLVSRRANGSRARTELSSTTRGL